MANASTIVFNQTLADDPDLCTLQTCPIAWATVTYDPSLAGNAFLLAVFAVCLVAQVVQGVMYRTWAFLVPWIFGLILECAGYGSRVSVRKLEPSSEPTCADRARWPKILFHLIHSSCKTRTDILPRVT